MEKRLPLWSKILIIVCMGAIFAVMLKEFGAPKGTAIPLSVVMDGEKLELDPKPLIIDERAMVPVRAFGDHIDVMVVWDNDLNMAELSKNGDILKVRLDRRTAEFNGEAVTLGTSPVRVEGSIYVPVTAFSNYFGLKTEFDSGTKTVMLTSVKQ